MLIDNIQYIDNDVNDGGYLRQLSFYFYDSLDISFKVLSKNYSYIPETGQLCCIEKVKFLNSGKIKRVKTIGFTDRIVGGFYNDRL
jgi:hypothetical protein